MQEATTNTSYLAASAADVADRFERVAVDLRSYDRASVTARLPELPAADLTNRAGPPQPPLSGDTVGDLAGLRARVARVGDGNGG